MRWLAARVGLGLVDAMRAGERGPSPAPEAHEAAAAISQGARAKPAPGRLFRQSVPQRPFHGSSFSLDQRQRGLPSRPHGQGCSCFLVI
jgi:hypothetical protein